MSMQIPGMPEDFTERVMREAGGGAYAFPRLARRLFDSPLLLEPGKAVEIAEAVGPRVVYGAALPALGVGRNRSRFDADRDVSDGVAVVDVSGSLVNRASGMDALSGIQSYEALRDSLMDAAASPGVRGILLRVDSPGGEAAGAFDLADDIARVAQDVPVWAALDDMAASAAYLIASRASKIFVTRTSAIGSVGVIVIHHEITERAKQMGVSIDIIRSGAQKARGNHLERLSESARERIQAEVMRLHGIFADSVAEARGISRESVDKTESALLNAEEALEIGFADQMGTVREALEQMQAYVKEDSPRRRATARVEVKEREAEMAEQRTDPAAAASTSAPPELPVKGSGEARGAGQGNAPSAASAKVDAAAVMEACGRYGLDAATSVVLARNCDSTDDAKQIAQLFAMEGKPAWMAEAIQKPGVTAEAMRDELFERKTKRDAGFDVNGANAGDEQAAAGPQWRTFAAVRKAHPDYRPPAGVAEVIENMARGAEGAM